ncbi:hypothetical protein D3C85_1159610 [compost metagenome]
MAQVIIIPVHVMDRQVNRLLAACKGDAVRFIAHTAFDERSEPLAKLGQVLDNRDLSLRALA